MRQQVTAQLIPQLTDRLRTRNSPSASQMLQHELTGLSRLGPFIHL